MATPRPSIPLLMRIPVPWVFVLAFLVGVVLQAFIPIAIGAETRRVARIAGIVGLTAGVALAVWALTIFRKVRTTTIPFGKSSALVTWGPYRFSRNPMYVALTVAYLGEAGILGQVWPLPLLLLTLVYVNGTLIPFEESRLQETFGDAYAQYRASVRRWV
jgi:protein-S-isoprenylcysteine O-methyltransferase Ste14